MNIFLMFSLSQLLLTEASEYFLNKQELTIALDILKQLQIRDCVFLSDVNEISDKYEPASQTKTISSQNIIFAFWNKYNFYEYFRGHRVYHQKAFIVKKFGKMQEVLDYNRELARMSKYTWLVFDDDFTSTLILYNCQFIQVQKARVGRYMLKESYSISGSEFVKDFGEWFQDSGLSLDSRTLYWRRLDFNQSGLVSIVLSYDRLLDCQEPTDECKLYEIYNDFSRIMNFQRHVLVASERNIVLLFANYGDVALFPTVWEFDDEVRVDKIGPIFSTVINWYIKFPSGRLRADFYLQPFERTLWFAIIFFLLLGSGVVIFEKLVADEQKFGIGSPFAVFEIFCGQSNEEADSTSLQTVLLVLNILGYVIVNSFGAVITSFLSVEISEIPFSNLDGFVKNGQYKLLLPQTGIIRYEMERSKNNLHKSIIDDYSVDENGNYGNSTISKGVLQQKTTSNQSYSVHIEPWGLDNHNYHKMCLDKNLAVYGFNNEIKVHELPCKVLRISEPLWKHSIVAMLRRMSPYTDSFNINLLRLWECGVKKKMQIDLDTSAAPVKNAEEEEYLPVEIEQMTHVLFIPIIGIFMATIVIFAELFYSKWKKYIFSIIRLHSRS